eukprot:9133177-Pyramimonas_sp.AAC.1
MGTWSWTPTACKSGDPDNDPAVVSRVADTSSWNRLHLQQICSESFFKAANSALRRTVLARTRPQPGPFQL